MKLLRTDERLTNSSNRSGCRAAITMVEMLVVVALTILLMSIIAEVFVLASGTLTQLRAVSDLNYKTRTIESIVRTDLSNRSIREVQPPVERYPGTDGVLGTTDDYVIPIGINPADKLGYFTLEEGGAADEQGEDADDVLAFTVKLTESARSALGALGSAYFGRVVPGSEPDQGGGLGASLEAEVIYFLRRGTLYRRVLLVGVPQPSAMFNPAIMTPPESWYAVYDVSARPGVPDGIDNDGDGTIDEADELIPIVNSLGDLTFRSARFAHHPPTNYDTTNTTVVPPIRPGLGHDYAGDPLLLSTGYSPGPPTGSLSFADSQTVFGQPGYQLHGYDLNDPDITHTVTQLDHNHNYPFALGSTFKRPELWFGRPLLRETSSRNWNYPDVAGSTVWADFVNAVSPLYHETLYNTATRRAEDAILTNVLSFDIKVWDPDAVAYTEDTDGDGTLDPGEDVNLNGVIDVNYGAYVDLGKLWPGNDPSVGAPGPRPSGGTLVGFPGLFPGPAGGGPDRFSWPPQRALNVIPTGRGFGEPFGYDWPPPWVGGFAASPPYAIPPITGADGQPGQAGNDDDGDGITDNLSELGLPDDIPGAPFMGMLRAPFNLCRTYDTWCTAYTKPTPQYFTDSNSNGQWDAGEPTRPVTPVAPPYITPLRGIQLKIRFVDPDTRTTREMTIVQELQ